MDEELRTRRKAAVAADEQRAKQKPPSRKRKAPVLEDFLESVDPFKDAPDRAVTLIGVRRSAEQRIFTSIVIKAAPNSVRIRIDKIIPFALKQEESSIPLKKRVRKLPEGLFREMSGAGVDDGHDQPKKRRRINAPAANASVASSNSITGGPQHRGSTKDSKEAFRDRLQPRRSYTEGEAMNLPNASGRDTRERSNLLLRNGTIAAQR